ncbi:cadherin-like beta sandwich domain-containing protein [Marinicrinis sediminis]|uniref:Cadherin-like beta sandwich domain-containing protein n=1 Tax=Marinicrinis sediminis TaxID=1652465 RepID=A0ABW5RAT4_9BACL
MWGIREGQQYPKLSYFINYSDHAELSALAISEGTLSPSFAEDITSYTADVANSVDHVTVTAAVYDSNATLKVNGTTATSGMSTSAIPLNVGDNTITVTVTAEDGITTKDYTVVVKRAALSTNAELSALAISAGTLSPSFAEGITSYTADVANSADHVTVTASVYDSNATLKVNGTTATSGMPSNAIPLNVGDNTITVTVTAEDGTTTKDYIVVVKRAATSGSSSSSKSNEEEIIVKVESGNSKEVLVETKVKRVRDKGTVKDEVNLSQESAKETVKKLLGLKEDTLRMVIPDEKNEVAEVNVSIPKASLNELKAGKTNLVIEMENVTLLLPNRSLAEFDQDLYFRVVPIKDETEQKQVEERAKNEQIIQNIAQNKDVKVLGRPADIETNMQNQSVLITLPLKSTDLPSDMEEKQQMINNLMIFIEHSDGTKELVKGEVVTHDDGSLDIQFDIDKFSTFTMLYIDGAEGYLAQLEEQESIHHAYISGYEDGTFKPDQHITRAEMATLLARNLSTTEMESVPYSDLSIDHWAYASIQETTANGLMIGDPDGQFRPEAVLTRAEMATIAFYWMDLQEQNEMNAFRDTTDHWAAAKIAALVQEGIMKGYPDGSFKPDQPLTRAEAVMVMNKMLDVGPLNGADTPLWSDVPVTHWAFEAIQEASMSHRYEIIEDQEVFVEQVK